jgi:hypothetical protein
VSDTLLTVPGRVCELRTETEGEKMAVVQLTGSMNDPELVPVTSESSCGACGDWLLYTAAGTLLAGGVLLVTGNRKAGLAVAATGTALAMIDQQDTVKAVWDALPGYLTEVQGILARVQGTVEEIAAQGARLRAALGK